MNNYENISEIFAAGPEKLDQLLRTHVLKIDSENDPLCAYISQNMIEDFTSWEKIAKHFDKHPILLNTFVEGQISKAIENDNTSVLCRFLPHNDTPNSVLLQRIANYICAKNAVNCLDMFMNFGARWDPSEHYALGFIESCKNGHIEIVRCLLPHIQRLENDYCIYEGFENSCLYAHSSVFEYLLPLIPMEPKSDRLLMSVVRGRNKHNLEYFLNYIAPLKINCIFAIQWCVFNSFKEAVDLLIPHADLSNGLILNWAIMVAATEPTNGTAQDIFETVFSYGYHEQALTHCHEPLEQKFLLDAIALKQKHTLEQSLSETADPAVARKRLI